MWKNSCHWEHLFNEHSSRALVLCKSFATKKQLFFDWKILLGTLKGNLSTFWKQK